MIQQHIDIHAATGEAVIELCLEVGITQELLAQALKLFHRHLQDADGASGLAVVDEEGKAPGFLLGEIEKQPMALGGDSLGTTVKELVFCVFDEPVV